MYLPSYNVEIKINIEIEGGGKKSRQAQNLANSKKSTILLQSL